MYNIVVIGAGNIGTLITLLLAQEKEFQIHLVDKLFQESEIQKKISSYSNIKKYVIDIYDTQKLNALISRNDISIVISCVPYHAVLPIAKLAIQNNKYYFDLTEDIFLTEEIKKLSKDTKCAVVPQCGLAPGFINMLAYNLIQKFDVVNEVKLRVGGLPQNSTNSLFYNITWSVDGLINEYLNDCLVIKEGKNNKVPALSDREAIIIDGIMLEAFNTSGGLGSLQELCLGKVNELNYKTIRYPGHCEKIKFMLHELKLKDNLDILQDILIKTAPKTKKDIVLVYASVNGTIENELVEDNISIKILPQNIANIEWSAIQISTAVSLCTTMDLILKNPSAYKSFVYQETMHLNDFQNNRFGKYLFGHHPKFKADTSRLIHEMA